MPSITGPKGLVKAAHFYCVLLGIDTLDFDLDITRCNLPGGNLGACGYDEEENLVDIDLDPRRYGYNQRDIYELLAHEMVHCKQYVTGQLREIKDGVTSWEGTLMANNTPDNYWDSPWELEAYGRQPGLYYKWCRYKE